MTSTKPKRRKRETGSCGLFADAEAKTKVAETNLLRHGYELDKSLPVELQQVISPASAETTSAPSPTPTPPTDRAAFEAAVTAVQTKQQQPQQNQRAEQQESNAPIAETTIAIAPTLEIAPNHPPTNFTTTMQQIAQRLVSMTVVGVPGAGKGMFVSNLLRQVRQHHPQLHIFVMEGKGDAKEAGYWQGVANDIRSIQGLDQSPVSLVAWINGCLDDFKAIDGPKLLIFR